MGPAHRTVKTWVTYLLLGVAGLYVAYGVAGTAAVLLAAASARHDVGAMLPFAESEADRSRDVVRTSMQSPPTQAPPPVRDPRPVGTAAYSWRELRCEIRSIDSGWIAVDFEQACELVDVDMYPTSLQPLEGSLAAGAEWSVEPDLPDGYVELDPATGTLGRCGSVPAERIVANTDQWPRVDLGTGRQLQADPRRTTWSCPTQIMAAPHPKGTVRLTGRRPEVLAVDSSWVVVSRTTPVSRSRLGCNPWLVGFCTSPLPAPWLPSV